MSVERGQVVKACRDALPGPEELPQSLLHASVAVLQRQEQHGPLPALDLAERVATTRQRQCNAERHPGLAKLGGADEQREALRDDPLDDPAQWREYLDV